jgi:hypothetical protein
MSAFMGLTGIHSAQKRYEADAPSRMNCKMPGAFPIHQNY